MRGVSRNFTPSEQALYLVDLILVSTDETIVLMMKSPLVDLAEALEVEVGPLAVAVSGGDSGLRESVVRRAVELHQALPIVWPSDCPRCRRPKPRGHLVNIELPF